MRTKQSKRGSYLVEAALTIPIFILAVFMLISSIPVYSTVENAIFSIADEMRMETVKSGIRENGNLFPLILTGRIQAENPRVTKFVVSSWQYLYREDGYDDLMTVSFYLNCSGDDFFNLFKQTSFDGKITARAYTGTLHQYAPGSDTDTEIVYIFPEWAARYHRHTCTYVTENCQMIYLTQDVLNRYQPCKLCDAQSAQVGNPVCVFQQYGDAYHIPECRLVERYYLQIERGKAIKQGYVPCSKCGG
jgi:hypothetical protein